MFNVKNKMMATKKEKVISTLAGAALGGFIASNLQLKQGDNIENLNNLWTTFKGVLFGGIGGYGLATIFGSPNNTVNYTHFNKRKRVYEGITYADRFDDRMAEHKASGKIFTRVVKGVPKPRIEALRLEKERILKYKPENNIQHNS